MISFDNVSKKYRGNDHSLHDISFHVDSGEFVTVVGHSGAGKTSIIRLLLGEEKPSQGSIVFDTIPVHELKSGHLPNLRRRIGAVFQESRLLPSKTVFENVAFAMEASGRTDDDIVSDVPYALELVGLGSKASSFPHELSGGERQRLAIARAIINQPEVLVADEPTAHLDPQATSDIVNILKKVHELGTTVLLTTHNRNVVEALKSRVITLRDGRIVRDDPHGNYEL
jgi:cell division transport system ATP-binding protein